MVVVNKAFWDELPGDVQYLLKRAMADATRLADETAARDNQEALDKVRALGTVSIHTPTASERLALKKALLPVHQQMSHRIGGQTLQEIYRATGRSAAASAATA